MHSKKIEGGNTQHVRTRESTYPACNAFYYGFISVSAARDSINNMNKLCSFLAGEILLLDIHDVFRVNFRQKMVQCIKKKKLLACVPDLEHLFSRSVVSAP